MTPEKNLGRVPNLHKSKFVPNLHIKFIKKIIWRIFFLQLSAVLSPLLIRPLDRVRIMCVLLYVKVD